MTSWDHDSTGCELPDVCYTDVFQIPLRIVYVSASHPATYNYVFTCFAFKNVMYIPASCQSDTSYYICPEVIEGFM